MSHTALLSFLPGADVLQEDDKTPWNQPISDHTVTDLFLGSLAQGRVIGSRSLSGQMRLGVDQEKVISVDNGALRIQPLARPGWGKATLAYGPYERQNGLALAVFMLNGHNTSQSEPLPESLARRIWRWARGSGTEPVVQRMIRWLLLPQKRLMLRQLAWWIHCNHGNPALDENLAVGWFPQPTSTDPVNGGNAFVMHAGGPVNGQLWARVGDRQQPVIDQVQNVPLYFFAILREQGTAYYVASLPGVSGTGAFPTMRPLALDAVGADQTVYAAIHQSVLGQIGFRVDSRVYGVQVKTVDQWATWYGTAQLADRLTGAGDLLCQRTATGQRWSVVAGKFERTVSGLRAMGEENMALLTAAQPNGLIHLLLETSTVTVSGIEILWRFQDQQNFWSLGIDGAGCHLCRTEAGSTTMLASNGAIALCPATIHALQLTDDGSTIQVYLDGQPLFAQPIVDHRLAQAGGVGLRLTEEAGVTLRNFEAHPRTVPIPPQLCMGEPWLVQGQTVVVCETFADEPGELAGRETTLGAKTWQKTIGTGHICLTDQGTAKVDATVTTPAPGRVAYTVEWDYPEFADLEIGVVPPGCQRGAGERGRAGLIFWQDEANYMIVSTWLDDCYGGASISSFFQMDGFEDIYNAVWTNVGQRIAWGVPYRLRVAFDGVHYLAFVNEEPVLYRTLTDVFPSLARLAIKRVGIVANWEWGNDTGSVFTDFVGRL